MTIADNQLQSMLATCISTTSCPALGECYHGKVRDSYSRGDTRIMVTTDRLSAFDRVLTTIPYKGAVLQSMAVTWFERTSDIISNHIVEAPDPQVLVVRSCQIVPIEVVVRGYLTGSAWRDYREGRAVSGIVLPPGLAHGHRFAEPLFTPSTKAAVGAHDEPVSESEIVARGIVTGRQLAEIKEIAFALFRRGSEIAAMRGLLLVDTKYEFGIRENRLMLADEIHTLDSSRYWRAASAPERLARGEQPEMLDKEPVRQWLLGQGFKGDGPVPPMTDEFRVSVAKHYLSAHEALIGGYPEIPPGDPNERVRRVLEELSLS